MFIYILLSFIVTLLTTPFFIRVAKRYRLFDQFEGDELKIHKRPIPYIGGATMLSGILVSLFVSAFIYQDFVIPILGVVFSAVLVFAFGFWDDWKWKHITQRKPYQKIALVLFVLMAMAGTLLAVGIRSEFFIPFIPSLLVSFGALFIVSNAINLEDGMDGLAGSLTLVSAVGFALVFLSQTLTLPLAIALALIGSVLAFLVFNFPPASIFMGDSGAYMVGSILAILILFLPQIQTFWGFMASIFLIGVPVFESAYSLGRRLLSGTKFILGDRNHVYDILLKKGYSTRKVLAVFFAAQALSVTLGVLILINF